MLGNVEPNPFEIACGNCVGCRLSRAQGWMIRCVHEAQMHPANAFLTLTYNNEHLPGNGSLQPDQVQRFMKRLRRAVAPQRVRFYLCGEYGEQFARPHYHALIFGWAFPDRVEHGRSPKGNILFRSPLLEDCWPFGYTSIGEVTRESAGYAARYVMKKITGEQASDHYHRVDPETGEAWSVIPEYNRMSLKPGLGESWLKRYWKDVYPGDFVVIEGKKYKPPRYYDVWLEANHPEVHAEVVHKRMLHAQEHDSDNTWERLGAREEVKQAQVNNLSRDYH